ncbi:MAG: S-layer homology domain-containing protein [Bacillota bacterium]
MKARGKAGFAQPRTGGRGTRLVAMVAMLAVVAAFSGPAALAAAFSGPPPSFPDLDGHWARFEIELLTAKGVAEAFFGGRFEPDVPVTRADLARMLVIGLGHENEVEALAQEPSTFADVQLDTPERPYIEVAYELGIVNGYPDHSFRPEADISRAEMTAMILRALGWEKLAQTTSAGKAVYPDQSAIADWAIGYALLAYKTGIIKGYPDGTFRPLDQTTRSQAVVLVARMLASMDRLYDLSGVVQSVELVDGALNLETPAGARRLLVRRDTPVYRNGQPITLGDIDFFDEAVVALDQSGRTAFVAAYLATRWGTLTAVAPDNGTITLDGVTVAVRPDASMYRHGRPATLSNLKIGDRVVAILKTVDGSNAVRALDAISLSATGVMAGYDIARRQLVVDVAAGAGVERRLFEVLPTTVVFLNGRRAGPTDLKPGDRLELATDQPGGPVSFVSAERPR